MSADVAYASAYPMIRERVEAAALRAGRSGQVRLLAVSKAQPDDKLLSVLQDGCRLFGENYVQEFLGKQERLPHLPGGEPFAHDVQWHFIGHLQTNKVKSILPFVSLIHSVDRSSLVQELQRRAASLNKTQAILLEVNLGGEASKSGIEPAALESLAREVASSPNLRLEGLMCIPPASTPEEARPFFQQLRRLRDALETTLGQPLPELSMGMSSDFEVAIEEGATLVRVGTALFGARHRPVEPA